MKTCLSVALVLLGSGLASCYGPDLSRVRYLCDPAVPRCPDGQACLDGVCRSGDAMDAAATTDASTDAGLAGK